LQNVLIALVIAVSVIVYPIDSTWHATTAVGFVARQAQIATTAGWPRSVPLRMSRSRAHGFAHATKNKAKTASRMMFFMMISCQLNLAI